MTEDQKVDWIAKRAGVSEREAERILRAIDDYTGDDFYDDIHTGADEMRERILDSFLNNRRVPVYGGETYRGLMIRDEPGRSSRSIVEGILKSGVWKEPGITSFSSSRDIASEFAGITMGYRSMGYTGVLLRNVRNRTGVPINHLSRNPHGSIEYEVMHPSSIKDRGFNILGYRQEGRHFIVDISEN